MPWAASDDVMGVCAVCDYAVSLAASTSGSGVQADAPDNWGQQKRQGWGRLGSKLSKRDPGAFKRLQAIVGHCGSVSSPMRRVTINTLQTHKFLFNEEDRQGRNKELLQAFAAYKVTTLNRELWLTSLDKAAVLLAGQRQ